MKNNIQHICHINQRSICLDGKVIFLNENQAESLEFLNEIYRFLKIDYPKFFKMDVLSKLAFIATEMICKKLDFTEINKESVGIVLENKSSSLMSDLTFQRSIQDKNAHYPSPAIFVYTLSNIMMGEMCIRHGFSNENALFITEQFDPILLEKYINHLFNEQIIEHCFGGWVEANPEHIEAFIYFMGEETTANLGKHEAGNISYLKNNSIFGVNENYNHVRFPISLEYQ